MLKKIDEVDIFCLDAVLGKQHGKIQFRCSILNWASSLAAITVRLSTLNFFS